MIGPGKYDAICTQVREQAFAELAVVIVLNGIRGSGFSCQIDDTHGAASGALARLPDMLEIMARQIRADQAQTQRAAKDMVARTVAKAKGPR